MRQGGNEACTRRRLRKRTNPSNPVGFKEKSLTAPERGVKSGLPTAWRRSRQQPGAFDAKIFQRWRKEERFSSGATLRRSVAKFFRKCSGMLRALSAQERSGLNAARLRSGISGRVNLEGRNGGDCVGASGKCGLLRQARLPDLVAGTHRLAVVGKACGELRAGAREASQRCAEEPLPAVLRVAGKILGRLRRSRRGNAGENRRRRVHGGRASSRRSPCLRSAAASAHSARRMFLKTPQRSLTAMPSSRSSSTSFCASAGTASRHTGESPSSMVL